MSAIASENLYDVFLSHSPGPGDDAVAMARAAFSAAGLRVFDASQLAGGADAQDQIWSALAVSDAIVVLATPSTVASAWTAVEIGAAQAWHKPIFVVQLTAAAGALPDFMTRFQVVPMSRLDDVVHAIRTQPAALTPHERELLREIYLAEGTPADRLIENPSELARFAKSFDTRSRSRHSAEVLVHELLGMRKRGELPRLKRGTQSN